MARILALSFCLASTASSLLCYHHYENMALFNFPVNATALVPYLQFGSELLTLDLDQNGVAWVSIVSSQLVKTSLDGVPVPFVKPFEVQVRTYVTGPDPDNYHKPIKGVWLFDLFLHDLPSVIGANVLFRNTIRVSDGDINIASSSGPASYDLKAPELKVTDSGSASVTVTSTILDTAVGFDTTFFLDRPAWFGQNKLGALTVSLLEKVKYMSTARQMRVTALASSALSALSLGGDVGKEVCEQHVEGCFFVGDSDATFTSSVVVAEAASELVQPLLV